MQLGWSSDTERSEILIVQLFIFPHCSQVWVTIFAIKHLCVRPLVCMHMCFYPFRDMIIVCCDIVMKPSGPLKLISLFLSLQIDQLSGPWAGQRGEARRLPFGLRLAWHTFPAIPAQHISMQPAHQSASQLVRSNLQLLFLVALEVMIHEKHFKVMPLRFAADIYADDFWRD